MPVLRSRLPSRFTYSKRLLHLCAGLAFVLALSNAALPAALCQTPIAPAAIQQTPHAVIAPADRSTMPAPANFPHGKGAHEGIKVNGYWKIDVRNPDGTLDKHVEFENSLTTNDSFKDSGDYALSAILAGATMMGDPGIGVNISPGSDQFNVNLPTTGFVELFLPDFSQPGPCGGIGCVLSTSSSLIYNDCLQASSQGGKGTAIGTKTPVTISSASCFNTLTVANGSSTYVVFFAPANGKAFLQLEGKFTASTSGNVTNVASVVTFCQFALSAPMPCAVPPGTAPGSFSPPFPVYPITFTSYTLPTPLPVGQGQAVNLSVSLTFN